MQLDISEHSLPVYSALDNPVRLQILRLLSEGEYNITQLAAMLHLSKAIVTKHVQQLEDARLLKSKRVPGKSGLQKLSQLAVDTIEISFPQKIYHSYESHRCEVHLGHFTDFSVQPTCGLATTDSIVGKLDDPMSFVLPERVNTALLWFSTGYVAYKIPCYLTPDQHPEMLEISLEIASEFPRSNNVWPSDISFEINGVNVGTWTCPGNYSDVRGFYTPAWWRDGLSQYGLLKHLRISREECNMDGEAISGVTIGQLDLHRNPYIDFRIVINEQAEHPGGVTVFGRGFGNHDQDINVKLYYQTSPGAPTSPPNRPADAAKLQE